MAAKVGPLPGLTLERRCWRKGQLVAGTDETGRGALAGPLVAAAAVLHPGTRLTGFWRDVNDSKKLSPSRRRQLAAALKQHTRHHAYGLVSAREIDDLGIERANQLALERALRALPATVHVVLADWIRRWPLDVAGREPAPEQRRFAKGDALHLSIAAASVLAKVYKDQYMADADSCFPAFGFGANSGYLTRQHAAALETQGPCPEHRYSFKPLSGRFARTASES